MARSPVKLALLFGGSALVTLAYVGGLVAVGRRPSGRARASPQMGAVYLGASVIAAASPTPGGLGAIEAAPIAGLTGIGISSGPAVSAVLVYRLATYWLPVLPGWLLLAPAAAPGLCVTPPAHASGRCDMLGFGSEMTGVAR